MTFRLIRSRRDPTAISVLITIPVPDDPTGKHLSEAPLFGRESEWIHNNFDITPIPEVSGETYEAITITPKAAAPAPEKETDHAD